MKKIYLVLLCSLLAAYVAGCCHTKHRIDQTKDNVHHLALDGEYGQMPVGEEDVTR